MRRTVERSLPWLTTGLTAWLWLTPPPALVNTPARAFFLTLLAAALAALGALRLLHGSSVPRDFSFAPLDDGEEIQRLQLHIGSVLAAGWEEGPALLATGDPGAPLQALPFIGPGGSVQGLVMNPVGKTEPEDAIIELLTRFDGGLRVSTINRRIAGAFVRRRVALTQILHGADDHALWLAHERVVARLEAAGLTVEPASAGGFQELLRASAAETRELADDRPYSSMWTALWRMLFAPSPYERPLFSQRAAVRELRARGLDVTREVHDGPSGKAVGEGGDWQSERPSASAIAKLVVAALLLSAVAGFVSMDMVGTLGWQRVDATIQQADVTTEERRQDGVTRTVYGLRCRYTYYVDGKKYPGDTCSLHATTQYEREEVYATRDELFAAADSGASWPAWTDPADPFRAVLFREWRLTGVVLFAGALLLWLAVGLKGLGALLWSAQRRGW